jgi:hypothetical protein
MLSPNNTSGYHFYFLPSFVYLFAFECVVECNVANNCGILMGEEVIDDSDSVVFGDEDGWDVYL